MNKSIQQIEMESNSSLSETLIPTLNSYEKPLADLFVVYGLYKNSLKGAFK